VAEWFRKCWYWVAKWVCKAFAWIGKAVCIVLIGACRDAGLPDPRFTEIANRFRVSNFTERVSTPVLDVVDQAIRKRCRMEMAN
jgi:hypothetical protein